MKNILAGSWALALTLAGVWGTTASAGPLEFDLTAQSNAGSVSFLGGATPLLGTNLQVASVTGFNSPSNPNAVLPIQQGTLNFATGAFTGTGTTGQEWDFGAGGSVSMTGAIPSLGITDPHTILLSGSFVGTPFVRPVAAGVNTLAVEGAGFLNLVNPTLASYFGLPIGTTYNGGLTFLFNGAGAPGSPFHNGDYLSGHLTSAPMNSPPVPEPSSVLVIGLGFAGLALSAHRRGRRAA